MARKVADLSIPPWHDSTDRELDQGYVKYLAVEGQILQNRELNVAQGLILGQVRRVTDVMIEDGSIISGCNFINNSLTKQCTLYAGEMYVNGLIIKIPEKIWSYKIVDDDDESTISMTDDTIVYADIIKMVYDERDDKALYDPAEKMENYGQSGGHRLKFEAHIGAIKENLYNASSTLSDFTRVKIYSLKATIDDDGNCTGTIIATPSNNQPIFGKIQKQMELRTYDQSGDFIAEGMQLGVANNRDNPVYKYNINVARGRAYVRGVMCNYHLATILVTDAATDTKDNGSAGESKKFNSNTTKYYLNNIAVATVYSVSGTLKENKLEMTYRTGTNIYVIPSRYTVNSVMTIWDNNKSYIQGSDYTVQGNSIIWQTSGSHPTGTFYVEFLYTGNLVFGLDYSINSDSTGYYIEFLSIGNSPAEGEDFNVKYAWYLSRIDLVYIREDGAITVKNGIPGNSDEIVEPIVPVGALPLAMVYVVPTIEPGSYVVNSYDIYRVPVAQLQNMKNRLSDLEYNVAMTKLENDAQSKFVEQESLSNLKNIYVDSVVDFSKADMSNSEYAATLDFFDSEIRLPQEINQLTKEDLTYSVYDLNGNVNHLFGDGILHLDTTSELVVDSQLLATNNIDITPFYFKGLKPSLSCSPIKLIHVEDLGETIIIWMPTRIVYKSAKVENWIRNQFTTNGKWEGTKYNVGNHLINSTSKDTTTVAEEIVTQTETVDLIPQPSIKAGSVLTLEGADWPPNTEIRLYIDDSIITPEFDDIMYKTSQFVMPATANISSYDNVIYNNQTVKRSHIWQWQKIKLSDASNIWKINHPKYTDVYGKTDGIAYYYNYDTTTWYYSRENSSLNISSLSNLTQLSAAPSWCKFLTRSPWINHYLVTDITMQDTRTVVESVNTTEPLTGTTYTDVYSDTKTTIITDSNGEFRCNIRTPAGLQSGTHTISAETMLPKDFNPDYYFEAGSSFSGESYIRKNTTYVYKRKVETITTTVYNTMLQITHNISSDPVAQSFVLSDEQFLSGIDIYFSHLPYSTSASFADRQIFNFTVSIREMLNGYPTSNILYSKTISGADVDAAGNYIIRLAGDNVDEGYYQPTHISFDNPVYVEGGTQYAFSVGSNRNGFHILYAQMGERNLIDNAPVTLQPSALGVMFASSDNSTWSPYQERDLTYRLYGLTFSTEKKRHFLHNIQYLSSGSISNYFSTMNISVDSATFENTDLQIFYGINVQDIQTYNSWLPLILEERYDFEPLSVYKSNGMSLSILFELSTKNTKVTPMINLNTLEIYLAKYKNVGSYVLNGINIQ